MSTSHNDAVVNPPVNAHTVAASTASNEPVKLAAVESPEEKLAA